MDSFISRIGGKKSLRNQIIALFPDQKEYDRYIEVFGGAGWVLFAKDRHAKKEVFNDADGNLINLFRCVKYHAEELQKELYFLQNSREQFFDAKAQINIRGLTDIQRAARYFMMVKCSFGSDLQSYRTEARDLDKAIDYLQVVQQRLKCTTIENNDFERILKTYDRATALFYLDPPYYNAEGYYEHSFSKADHLRLKERLDQMQGKFLLSYNDCQEVRQLYADYNITEIDRQHNLTAMHGPGSRYKELILRNYST